MRHALLCHNLRTLMHWLVITILVRPMCNFHVEHITLNCVCKKALIIHLVIIYVCRFYFILIKTCRSILSFCCWQSVKKQQSRIFRFDEVIKLQWVCFNHAIACMMPSYNRSYLHLRSLNFDLFPWLSYFETDMCVLAKVTNWWGTRKR
jgi:uncharacterized membrane protein